MSGPPTRYENYSTTPDPALPDVEPDPRPEQRVVTARPAVAPQPSTASRRAFMTFVIGLPALGVAIGVMMSQGPERMNPVARGMTAEIGGYETSLPKGWNVVAQADGRLGLRKGDDVLYAYPQVWGTSTRAVEEIGALVDQLLPGIPGVEGKVGTAVDGSTINLQRAALTGTATVTGRSARLLANLWLDRNGTGLLVVRVLVSKANSIESMEAQGMSDQLSAPFQ